MFNLAGEIRMLQQMLVALSTSVEDLRPALALGSKSYIDQLVSGIQQTRNQLTKTPTPGSVTHAKENLTFYRAQYEELKHEREDPGYLARRDLSDTQSQLWKDQEQVALLRKELSEVNKQLRSAKQETLNVQKQLDDQVSRFDTYKKHAVTARQEFMKRISDLQENMRTANQNIQDDGSLISKGELKNCLMVARSEIADYRRDIEKYRRDIKSLSKQKSDLKSQLAIANSATESSQERLVQSYESRKFLEQELAELKKNKPLIEWDTTQKKNIQTKVEQTLPSQSIQHRLPSSPEKFQNELERLRAVVNEKTREIMHLQQEQQNAQIKLKGLDYELQLKSGDATRFKNACTALQKEAAEYSSVKDALQKEVETLQQNVEAKETEVTRVTTGKHDMYQKLRDCKEKLEAALSKKREVEQENNGIKRTWQEMAHTMASFAENWKEPEQEEERKNASEELSQANGVVPATISQQNLHDPWPATGSSPRTPKSQNRRKITISHRSEVDEQYEELEFPSALLKQKEESKILGYTKVKEHYRKILVKKS